jgi:hypothetical protein
MFLILLVWTPRAHGVRRRINDATPPVWTRQIRRSATIKITFGQQGSHHAEQGKHETDDTAKGTPQDSELILLHGHSELFTV